MVPCVIHRLESEEINIWTEAAAGVVSFHAWKGPAGVLELLGGMSIELASRSDEC